jgi:hypothetical protein
MNNALKGALLSGVVYPGAGQIAQKHYFRGLALIAIATASLGTALMSAAERAQAILARIESGRGGDDFATLLREATRAADGGTGGTMGFSVVAMLACWVVGIADAYVCGKRIDRGTAARHRAGGTP